jgi:hypothetical protein
MHVSVAVPRLLSVGSLITVAILIGALDRRRK